MQIANKVSVLVGKRRAMRGSLKIWGLHGHVNSDQLQRLRT